MDLLSVHDATASKPSLISSLWSLQVQNDANELERRLSFQQSLPDLDRPYSPQMRTVKSLSDLSLLPSGIPCSRSIVTSNSCSIKIPVENEKLPLNRFQKDQNISEWLQKLDINDANSETDSLNSFSFTCQDEKIHKKVHCVDKKK